MDEAREIEPLSGPALPQGFELLDRLEHKELIPFVQQYMRKFTPSSMFYLSFVAFTVGLIAYELMLHIDVQEDFSYSVAFTFLYCGFFGAIFLVPLHEGIHLVVYRFLGAKQTSMEANWRKFYFMALAHHFVCNRREFQVLALAPFVSISAVLLLLWFIVPVYWGLAALGMLLLHTLLCGGDFGLLSYFDTHRDKDVLTWDDTELKVSWFYGRARKDLSAL